KVSLGSCPSNDLVTFLPSSKHLGNYLWWVLQVCIHYNHCIASRIPESSSYCSLMTKVTRKTNISDTLVSSRSTPQPVKCGITRTIVDYKQFQSSIKTVKN